MASCNHFLNLLKEAWSQKQRSKPEKQTQRKSIHPVSSYVHRGVAKAALNLHGSPKSILDIGGTGKMHDFIDCEITNANILDGIDGSNLPYDNKSFDLCTSVAVIEHVEDWRSFLSESMRVCRFGAAHWFPFGPAARKAEEFKEAMGHRHPCSMHERADVEAALEACCGAYTLEPYMSIGEHLLLLATIHSFLNEEKTFALLEEIGSEPYGFLIKMKP